MRWSGDSLRRSWRPPPLLFSSCLLSFATLPLLPSGDWTNGGNLNCVGDQEEQHSGGGGQRVQRDGRHRRLLHPHLGLRPPRLHQIPRPGTARLLPLLSGPLLLQIFSIIFLSATRCSTLAWVSSSLSCWVLPPPGATSITLFLFFYFHHWPPPPPVQKWLATFTKSALIFHQIPCSPSWDCYEPGKL